MSRTVLVTGANSGLGLATVLDLARAGVDVVGTVRTPAKAELVAAAAEAANVTVTTRLLDITDPDRCAEVVDEVRPYALVNNAGSTCWAPVALVDDDTARRQLEAGVIAPMRLARLALPYMRERGEGRVIQISSVAGRVTYPLLGWYQGAKHAIEAVSDALRLEVARDGVRVVVIAPGGFRSGQSDELAQAAADHAEGGYATAFKRLDLGFRMVRPLWTDVARIAAVVTRAVTTDNPAPRYTVGNDARISLLMNEVVERLGPVAGLRDLAVRTVVGLR